jgi:hypothetical protein
MPSVKRRSTAARLTGPKDLPDAVPAMNPAEAGLHARLEDLDAAGIALPVPARAGLHAHLKISHVRGVRLQAD